MKPLKHLPKSLDQAIAYYGAEYMLTVLIEIVRDASRHWEQWLEAGLV